MGISMFGIQGAKHMVNEETEETIPFLIHQLDFYVFKERFLQGFDVLFKKEWIPACEQHLFEFGHLHGVETFEDVIEQLSNEYMAHPEKVHLRPFLKRRLEIDLGL